MMRDRIGGRNSHPIRTAWFLLLILIAERGLGHGCLAIKRLELVYVNFFDVAANAALGEGKSHPGLEVLDHPWFYFRVLQKVVVEAVGESVHKLLQPGGALRVLFLQRVGLDEKLHAQVLIDFRLAICLSQSAHGIDVVGLDAIEIVFGLGINRAEYRIRIRFSVNVGDAPIVADDSDASRFLLPTGNLRLLGSLGKQRDRCSNEDKNELFEVTSVS